jgi:uncharacterized protein (TIGR02646 family)
MLRFAKGPQPPGLTEWQATPLASWDDVPSGSLWPALLADQGHLCAYCQRRLRDDEPKVEHWHPQSSGERDRQWTNLLAVCSGRTVNEKGRPEPHCDVSRGDQPLFLHPVHGQGPDPCAHLKYSREGECVAVPDRANVDRVKADITALCLNAWRLKRGRKVVLDTLRDALERESFSTHALRREYRRHALVRGQSAPEHAEVVRYHLRRWARQKNLTL